MTGRFIKSFDGNKIYYDINKKGNKFLIFLHGWPHTHDIDIQRPLDVEKNILEFLNEIDYT